MSPSRNRSMKESRSSRRSRARKGGHRHGTLAAPADRMTLRAHSRRAKPRRSRSPGWFSSGEADRCPEQQKHDGQPCHFQPSASGRSGQLPPSRRTALRKISGAEVARDRQHESSQMARSGARPPPPTYHVTALLTSKGQQLRMRPEVGFPALQLHGPAAQFTTGRHERRCRGGCMSCHSTLVVVRSCRAYTARSDNLGRPHRANRRFRIGASGAQCQRQPSRGDPMRLRA